MRSVTAGEGQGGYLSVFEDGSLGILCKSSLEPGIPFPGPSEEFAIRMVTGDAKGRDKTDEDGGGGSGVLPGRVDLETFKDVLFAKGDSAPGGGGAGDTCLDSSCPSPSTPANVTAHATDADSAIVATAATAASAAAAATAAAAAVMLCVRAGVFM